MRKIKMSAGKSINLALSDRGWRGLEGIGIADEIKKLIPEFSISYHPDFRQTIADSWPKSFDDSPARKDWGWQHKFDLKEMTAEIFKKLSLLQQ